MSGATFLLGLVFVTTATMANVLAKELEAPVGEDLDIAGYAEIVTLNEYIITCYLVSYATMIVYGLTLSRAGRILVQKLSLRSVVSQF